MKMIVKLTVLLVGVVALTAGGAIAQNTVTLFDDGDLLYNGGIYELEGVGRPAAAATPTGYAYDGTKYLSVLGDPNRSTARYANRVAAFVRNDVGLDHSQDWHIKMDIANDYVMPDYGFSLWIVGSRPDATWLNLQIDGIRNPDTMTFSFGCGDQLPGDIQRGGFAGDYWNANRLLTPYTGLIAPRLDPDPDETILRGGHNRVTIEWIAASQRYYWTISNVNGVRSFSMSASELALQPSETYFLAGSALGGASGWTIFSIEYGQGPLTTPPFTIELDGSGTATVGGNPAADEDGYFGGPMHSVATGAGDASFVKTGVLNGAGWTIHGKSESQPGTTYSHQLMSGTWSGQPEPYSGIPSTLMLQVLQSSDSSVSFRYVNGAGSVLSWNQATKSWEAGSNVLDIVLDGGGNDEWWVAYDGTNYWLSVTNGSTVRAAAVPASSVRGGGASCFFSAGRVWTTGWSAADFSINSLELVPYFSGLPLSTGPFIVELAGGATANVDGFPVSDGGTYDGLGTLSAVGENAAMDAAVVKTQPLGWYPWTVSFYFASRFADNYAFGVEVKDNGWSGQPGPFPGWPGSNKMMLRCENALNNGQVVYWNPDGQPHWYDIWSGPWPMSERMLEFAFAELPFDFPRIRVAIGFDGSDHYLSVYDGESIRVAVAPNGTPDPMREQNSGGHLAIGDAYTDMNPCEFQIQNATMVPYFDRALFPYYDPWTVQVPIHDKICEVEQVPNGRHLKLVGNAVSRAYGGAAPVYFVQEPDRSCGMAVFGGDGTFGPGAVRSIAGIILDIQGERALAEEGRISATTGTMAAPEPLGVNGRTLGGGPLGLVKGVELGTGLNNLGLLVKTTGKVTYVADDNTYFLIDDGSGIADDPAGLGVRVQASVALTTPPAVGSYVAVTGGARPYVRSDGKLGRAVMVNESDIQVLQAAP